MALNSLAILERELRNPRFILVLRDAVAVAAREVVAMGTEAMGAMRRALILAGAHDRFCREPPVRPACFYPMRESAAVSGYRLRFHHQLVRTGDPRRPEDSGARNDRSQS